MNEDRFHDFTDGNFSYLELETFGEMMMDLPNICSEPSAEDMSSTDIIRQLARVSCEFEKEWLKMTDSEHEEAGEDWLDEVAKLAKWVKEHLYDVLHNELEYGMYRARRRVWGYETRPKLYYAGTKFKWVSASKEIAKAAMFDDARSFMCLTAGSKKPAKFEFQSAAENDECEVPAKITVSAGADVVEYRLVSKWEDS